MEQGSTASCRIFKAWACLWLADHGLFFSGPDGQAAHMIAGTKNCNNQLELV